MQFTAILLAGVMAVSTGTAAAPGEQPEEQNTPQVTVESIETIPVSVPTQTPVQQNQPSQTAQPALPVTPVAPAPVSSKDKNYSVVLGEYITSFSTSNTNRCTNLKIASEAMNGYIVEPGAEFSFNTVVGQRTTAKGYKSAPVISNGKYSTGVGGGVCQISTTLFNAALESNMKITARRAHSLKSSYVPAGRDASVSYGSVDFKFVNPYSQPVKIVTNYSSKGTVKIAIMGPEGSSKPWVQINVTGSGKNYTLTRSYGGSVNYTATSKYN